MEWIYTTDFTSKCMHITFYPLRFYTDQTWPYLTCSMAGM